MAMNRCREGVLVSKPQEAPGLRDEHMRCFNNPFSLSLISARERELVCVTSGNSYLGANLVKNLLAHGYLVRVTIQTQVDFEDMKELIREEEMNQLESIVIARPGDLDSLCDAFRGCHVIFHTSSFVDPHGVSGYTERMAFLETEGASNVIEACGRAAYVKRCIFTSSLLASIWSRNDIDKVVDEGCWSNEEFCRENKLWLALGKTTAEKVAWKKSRELKVRLVTVCPGLLMVPSFPDAHTETSLPYLKGGHTMLQRGVLAVEDVGKVAEAHLRVYEAMDYGACGRYLCYGRIVRTVDEAIQLENRLKIHGQLLMEETDEIPANITNSRLSRLLFRAAQRVSCKR